MNILPYNHPTTVFFVDDNANFLNGIDLNLDFDIARQCFSSARSALASLEATQKHPNLSSRYFCTLRNKASDTNMAFSLNLIETEVSNLNRFKEVSVVVVDYDMPEMNGIEFCGKLKDSPVKKLMLTSIVDKTILEKAVEEGIIDHFINKHSINLLKSLKKAINELQREYFNDIADKFINTLSLNVPAFMRDDKFKVFFYDLLENKGFVEYYLVDNPKGFLLINREGDVFHLLVYSEDELAKIDEQSKNQYSWNNCLTDATNRVKGNDQTYCFHLATHTPVNLNFLPQKASYDAFLEYVY
jgi:CheY-like chemotaxis protein